MIFGAQSIVEWLYSHMESQRQTHTARLLGILSWQVVMSAIIGWSQVVHHSRHSFIVPAMVACGNAGNGDPGGAGANMVFIRLPLRSMSVR